MITKIASCSSNLGRCVMKSNDTLFQDLIGIDKYSRSPQILVFSTLSCWYIRHVLVYVMISFCMFVQKYPFFTKA